MRKNTVTDELEEVKSAVCDRLCKWRWLSDKDVKSHGMDPDDAWARLQKHCDRCPLNRL